MTKPAELTTIILCKNGERTLARALSSVAFADRIIVGDDGSTDGSISIARSMRADVVKVPAGTDFSKKRNYLLEYVRTDWALFIDVDEEVSPALQVEIVQKLRSQDDIQGYLIPRHDVFMGRMLKYGETAHTTLLRMAKVRTGTWERAVHEVWNVSGRVGKLHAQLHHYSHPTLEEFVEKINRYTEIEATIRCANSIKIHRFTVLLQLVSYPPAKFIQNYLFRRGCMDGYAGLVMAWMMSLHSLCVRIKILERLSKRDIMKVKSQ